MPPGGTGGSLWSDTTSLGHRLSQALAMHSLKAVVHETTMCSSRSRRNHTVAGAAVGAAVYSG